MAYDLFVSANFKWNSRLTKNKMKTAKQLLTALTVRIWPLNLAASITFQRTTHTTLNNNNLKIDKFNILHRFVSLSASSLPFPTFSFCFGLIYRFITFITFKLSIKRSKMNSIEFVLIKKRKTNRKYSNHNKLRYRCPINQLMLSVYSMQMTE